MATMLTGEEILALPMDPSTNSAGATSVREYLVALARVVWVEGEGMSGKCPFGDSGWECEVYAAIGKKGRAGDTMVLKALEALAGTGGV